MIETLFPEELLIVERMKRELSKMFISGLIYQKNILFMNNLSVVLLFTYTTIYLANQYHIPITPILVSLVVSSNIGGAALPWADTPAVILTLYTDFSLFDFLNKMLFPCFLFIVFLCGYTYIWYRFFSKHWRESPVIKKEPIKWKELRIPLILFVGYIIGLCVGPFLMSRLPTFLYSLGD